MYTSSIQNRGISLLLLLTIASPSAGQQTHGGKIYVANQASNDVTVVDAMLWEVVATVPVEDRPHNVNHTPDGRFLLVTNKNVHVDRPASVSIIRVDGDEVVATVPDVGERIEHVVSPTENRAYVTEDLGENVVLTIDLESRVVTSRVRVGVKPHGLWPSPDGRYLFVPNQLSGTVSKVDTETMEVEAEARVGRTPTMVAMSPDGRFVLVPCEGPGALYIVSANSHEVVAEIPTGRKAHGVDVSADGRYAFVSNWADNSVSVVDLERRVVVREIGVGNEPAGIDYVP